MNELKNQLIEISCHIGIKWINPYVRILFRK